MSDILQAVTWLFVLALGVTFCVFVRNLGLRVTYVRDILHISTGIWVFGWKYWHNPAFPSVITVLAFALIFILPKIKVRALKRFIESVSDEDETWNGIVLYVFSFMVFTIVGFCWDTFSAGASLLCLSFGDGIGGSTGRLFGRRFYALPWGKKKSLEGSIAVFASSVFAILISAEYFDVEIALALPVLTALIVSIAEALSPKALDNLFVPVFAYLFLAWGGRI